MQNVSRNGSLLLNLTQHGRGNLDPQCTQIAQDIGAWLKVNGEAVYRERPWAGLEGGRLHGADVAIYPPKQSGNGKIEIKIDGQSRATPDLSTTGARLPQQMVSEVTGLTAGSHSISVINRGPGPVAVDAIVVR